MILIASALSGPVTGKPRASGDDPNMCAAAEALRM